MCTVIVFHDVDARYPLALAGNRDEALIRSCGPPQLLDVVRGIYGPFDAESGGSWVAARRDGCFAAVTNFMDPDRPKASLPGRSRGQLVTELLQQADVAAMRDWLLALPANSFRSFNLVFGQVGEVFVGYGRTDLAGAQVEQVERGIHVLGNDRLDAPSSPRAARLRTRLERDLAATQGLELPALLVDLLRDHERCELADVPARGLYTSQILQSLDAVCVHLPEYGTRASWIMGWEHQAQPRFWFCSTAPCVGSFQEYAPAMRNP